jgi:hypothetical protein
VFRLQGAMQPFRRPLHVGGEDKGRLRDAVARARQAAPSHDATTTGRLLGPRIPTSTYTYAVRPRGIAYGLPACRRLNSLASRASVAGSPFAGGGSV